MSRLKTETHLVTASQARAIKVRIPTSEPTRVVRVDLTPITMGFLSNWEIIFINNEMVDDNNYLPLL